MARKLIEDCVVFRDATVPKYKIDDYPLGMRPNLFSGSRAMKSRDDALRTPTIRHPVFLCGVGLLCYPSPRFCCDFFLPSAPSLAGQVGAQATESVHFDRLSEIDTPRSPLAPLPHSYGNGGWASHLAHP